MFGLIMGSWAGRIPALRDGVQASHSSLSLILLCGGLGALLSFPFSSWMMASFGARKTLFYSGLALLGVLLAIGNAPTVPLLMLAVLSLGITASCFDVAINSVAAKYEKTTGKSEFSRLHAWGCGGGLLGATLGSFMGSLKIDPSMHFLMVAVPLTFVLKLGCELLEADHAGEKIEKKVFCLPRGPLAFLGALGFFGSVAEGSIADWSGIFLKDHFGVGDGFAPLALTAFSVMMLITRLLGDKLKGKYSARKLLCWGPAIAAAALLFATLAPTPHLALAGFAAAGLGLALVFPFVFSAAGQQGPMALAGVATMAYSGTLIGPPVIGGIAHGLGMQAAIGFIGLLGVVIAFIASRTAMLK
jgi:MFS family permease